MDNTKRKSVSLESLRAYNNNLNEIKEKDVSKNIFYFITKKLKNLNRKEDDKYYYLEEMVKEFKAKSLKAVVKSISKDRSKKQDKSDK